MHPNTVPRCEKSPFRARNLSHFVPPTVAASPTWTPPSISAFQLHSASSAHLFLTHFIFKLEDNATIRNIVAKSVNCGGGKLQKPAKLAKNLCEQIHAIYPVATIFATKIAPSPPSHQSCLVTHIVYARPQPYYARAIVTI
jgi:hypothetical protein